MLNFQENERRIALISQHNIVVIYWFLKDSLSYFSSNALCKRYVVVNVSSFLPTMKDALQSPSALNQDGCLTHEGCSPAPDDNRLLTSTDKESIKITRKYVPVLTRPKRPRVSGRVRYVYLVSGCLLFVVSLVLMVAGTIRVNQCNKEEEVRQSIARLLMNSEFILMRKSGLCDKVLIN